MTTRNSGSARLTWVFPGHALLLRHPLKVETRVRTPLGLLYITAGQSRFRLPAGRPCRYCHDSFHHCSLGRAGARKKFQTFHGARQAFPHGPCRAWSRSRFRPLRDRPRPGRPTSPRPWCCSGPTTAGRGRWASSWARSSPTRGTGIGIPSSELEIGDIEHGATGGPTDGATTPLAPGPGHPAASQEEPASPAGGLMPPRSSTGSTRREPLRNDQGVRLLAPTRFLNSCDAWA